MEIVEYVINEYDFVDEDRLGVIGGSYGGFMTNWIVGHTDAFKAAVSQRSISSWFPSSAPQISDTSLQATRPAAISSTTSRVISDSLL